MPGERWKVFSLLRRGFSAHVAILNLVLLYCDSISCVPSRNLHEHISKNHSKAFTYSHIQYSKIPLKAIHISTIPLLYDCNLLYNLKEIWLAFDAFNVVKKVCRFTNSRECCKEGCFSPIT